MKKYHAAFSRLLSRAALESRVTSRDSAKCPNGQLARRLRRFRLLINYECFFKQKQQLKSGFKLLPRVRRLSIVNLLCFEEPRLIGYYKLGTQHLTMLNFLNF